MADLPTMSGYLDYKNRIARGEHHLDDDASKAWRENLFKQKPAIVHYQDALGVENHLERIGAADQTLRTARTSTKLAQMNAAQTKDDHLLFHAKTAADREILSEALKQRQKAVEQSTPILDKAVSLTEAMRNRAQQKARDRSDDRGR
jgi:hypothetical protein